MSLKRLGDPSQTLYLVDISAFIFRAFFAIRSLTNRRNEPTNAIYGVATMLARLCEEANPKYLAIAYDSKEPSNRKEVYAEYKANRAECPEDLVPQFDKIEELVRLLGMHSFRKSGLEADDLIGTLAKRWTEADPKHRVVIVSGDKDLMQLVNDRVMCWDTMSGKIYEAPEVEEKFGIPPSLVRDYLGLVGDSSDNIPGVPGIGPKSAVDLLKAHKDLDGVLAAAKKGEIPGKKGENLRNHEADAVLSAKLATVDCDCEVDFTVKDFEYKFKVSEEALAFLADNDFHSLVRKWSPEGAAAGASAGSSAGASSAAAPAASKPAAPASPTQTAKAAETRASAAMGSSFASGLSSAPKPKPAASAPTGDAQGSLFGSAQPQLPPLSGDEKTRFRTVATEKDLKDLIAGIEKSREFGFDLETTSLVPLQAEIVGIAICHDPAFGCYIPVGHIAPGTGELAPGQLARGRVLEALKPYLEDPRYKKIGQNLKYDWSVLRANGLNPDGIGADTMVAAYVLEPEGRHNLETLARKHLDYVVTTYEQICGKGKSEIPFAQVSIETATRYSGEDAWVAVQLWRALRPKLEEARLMPVFAEVDLPLVQVLSAMELEGVCIDEKWLESLSTEFARELERIEARIQAHAPGAASGEPVNLNSPKQLAKLLFEDLKLPTKTKTKTGFSTDASVLEELASLHEVPKLLLEYREISKLKGTYVDPLPGMRNPKTGKIHASFNQTVAATGRLSGADPNLQNIPIRTERGRKIRRAFVPSRGNLFVSADYSQIELRLLAHMSGDTELVRSFRSGEDVHRRTASEIFSVAPEKVDDRQRGIAKAINFGLMYGKTAFGLAAELKISRTEAQDTIKRYFERYQGVKRFLDGLIIEAKEKGYAATLLGRRRNLPDIRSNNPAVRAIAERMAMNTPIQGTAADLMKIAMIRIQDRLVEEKYRSKLIIQVHDEVVLDCPSDEARDARKLITEVMEGAMALDVPLIVNSSEGENWMDL